MNVIDLKLTDIKKVTDNHRVNDDASSLMLSIKKTGLLNPVTVMQIGKTKKYKLIAGFRRMAAVKKLNLKTIPAHVVDKTADETVINLVENIQREDANSYEVGRGIYQAMTKGDLTEKEVSALLGISSSVVKTYLSLYKHTPKEFRSAVRNTRMSGTNARKRGDIPNSVASAIVTLQKNNKITKPEVVKLFTMAKKDKGFTASDVGLVAKKLQTSGADAAKKTITNLKTYRVNFKMSKKDFKKLGTNPAVKIKALVQKHLKVDLL